jgi:conjugal transfer pilus assembly protein TraW
LRLCEEKKMGKPQVSLMILGMGALTLISLHASVHATSLNSESIESQTEDLGVYGAVFPIQEHSLLEVIQRKLQALKESGEMEAHQKSVAEKTKKKVMRPDPVDGVHKTTNPRTFTYDPSLTVPYDLKDHQGQVFHPKGTRVNPLDHYTFRRPFLFLDGDDEDQVAWADNQCRVAADNHKPKLILVKGMPFELSKKLNLPVYFDQSGTLVKKFGIKQVPARISQKGKRLLVEELVVNENHQLRTTGK